MESKFFIVFILVSHFSLAQIGGQQAFVFLNLPPNAQIGGFGGINISSPNGNVSNLWASPALADSSWYKQIVFNFSPYIGDTKAISMAYGLSGNSKNRWAVGMQYLNYGSMQLTDATGNATGTFSAADYALATSYARTEGAFTLGSTLKLVGSGIETYQSYTLMADVAGLFKHPKHDFSVGIVVKNVGLVFKPFFSENTPKLPLDVQLGLSLKPKYMPARVSITAQQLYQWDVSFNDPKLNFKIDANGNKIYPKSSFVENTARHLVLGIEILAHQNISILLGYNHSRKQELKLSKLSSGAGLSGGLAYIDKRIGLTYSFSSYHKAGGLHSFTLSYSLKNAK